MSTASNDNREEHQDSSLNVTENALCCFTVSCEVITSVRSGGHLCHTGDDLTG